jgi:hypothetical protein
MINVRINATAVYDQELPKHLTDALTNELRRQLQQYGLREVSLQIKTTPSGPTPAAA